MADIVDDILQRLRAVHEVPADKLQRVEADVRQQWGGTEPYVRRGTKSRANADQRAATLGACLQQGMSLQEACSVTGTSRRAGFRLAARRVGGFVKG